MLNRILLFTLLTFVLAFGAVSAAVFVVEAGGNPATTYPNLNAAFITAAANPAGPHQIYVKAGNYSDINLTVPVNVDLIQGDDPATVIFQPATAQVHVANFLTVGDVTLVKNLTVKKYNEGIILPASGGTRVSPTLENMIFENNVIAVHSSGNAGGGSMTNCEIFNSTNVGVYLQAGQGFTVENSTIFGDANYAVYIAGATGAYTVRNNCFYNHSGAEGYDDTPVSPWSGNYYDDYSGTGSYVLAGGGVNWDPTPNTFTNNPVSSSATWEVYSIHTVDFQWTAANCTPQEMGLAAYSFTVNWDPAKLELQAGSWSYDNGLLGGTALYAPIIDSSSVGKLIFSAANYTNPGFGSGRLGYAAFKPKVTGGGSIWLTSQYLDMNNDPLPTKTTALALTLTDTQKPVVTAVTPNNPAGDNSYSDPAGNPDQLMVDVTATDNYGLTSLWYDFDGGTAWKYLGPASGTSYTTPAKIYVDITGLPEGNHTLDVIASDGVNLAVPFPIPFSIDRTAPAITGITMADPTCPVDPEYTNDRLVSVAMAGVAGTPTKMEFYLTAAEGPIAFADPTAYTLPDADGAYTLYVRLYDIHGNVSGWVSDVINLDRTAPAPTGWVLAGGAAKTNTLNITGAVGYYGGSGAATLKFSENAADLVCGSAGWAALANPVNITLSSADNTLKTVYYATRDLAGNVSTPISDDIYLDMTAPQVTDLVVKDASDASESCTDNWTVDVTVSFTATDAIWLGISNTTGTGYEWHNITGMTSPVTFPYTIVAGSCDANNTIFAVLEDDIANRGAEASKSIFVDCTVPTAGTMALDGGVTWSTDNVVDVTLSGMAMDITYVRMSRTSGDYTGSSWVAFDPTHPTVQYTFVTPPEVVWVDLYLEAKDCAGRISAEVTNHIAFDFTDPVINTVSINSGAIKTNALLVSVAFTFTELRPLQIMLGKDAAFTGASWQAYSPSPVPFTLASPDGTKSVYIKMKDESGRISAAKFDDIILDMAPPTGTFTILSGNPEAASGYTNSLANNTLVGITYSGDAVSMRFKNLSGSYTGWTGVASTYPSPWTLTGPEGTNTVQVQFRDDAMNIGGPFNATIIYDATSPNAPATAVGVPGGSLNLGWSAVAGAYKYATRYTFWNDYPKYQDAVPPHPLALNQGLAGPVVTAPVVETPFDGPQPDIYAISIWTMDSAGNYSAVPNTQILAPNYVLGDFNFNDAVEFQAEFGDFAGAYYRCDPQDGYKDFCDIGPLDITGVYPIPDGCINFEDLVVFAMNYDQFGAPKGRNGVPLKIGPVVIYTQLPDQMTAGSEYTISIQSDNPSIMKGFHLVFDFDKENLEVVNVKQGKMFETSDQTFFYHNVEGRELLLDGVIFGSEARFKETEIAQVTIRAIHSMTSVDMKDMVLTVRDNRNKDVATSFSATLIKGATPAIPTAFSMSQNYPNPFNPSTVIELALPVAGTYTLDIYNVVGQKVKSFNGFSEAGIVNITWNASDAASGVYFYKVTAGSFTATKKMMLVK